MYKFVHHKIIKMNLEIDILWCEIFRYAKKIVKTGTKNSMFQLCSSYVPVSVPALRPSFI